MTRRSHKSVKLFCSYSHRDERYLDKLKTCLAGLKRQGLIEEWHDRKILPGQVWAEAIDENLKTSEIVLLLVSPDFMYSDFSYEKEMKQALDKDERGETRVIPIIVRPADWQWAPFGKLQALPKDGKPITTWSNRDRAWLNVVEGIRKAVEELTSKPGVDEPTGPTEHTSLHRYREGVESVWADGELNRREVEWLRELANDELGLSPSTAADIEREVMGDTKETVLECQKRAAEEEYRKAVAEAWTDKKLSEAEVERLGALANELDLRPDTAAGIERETMNDTVEAILERQAQLAELYAQARWLHQAQEWQAVVDIFDRIRALDPTYPDPEGLLESAREELANLERRVAAEYDQGLQHMEAEDWPQALRCLEEVQQLESGYRQTEELLACVQQELADRAEQGPHDDSTDDIEHADSRSTAPWEYVDLELEIRKGDRLKYPVVVRSVKDEEVREEMHFPFDKQELADKLLALENAVLISGTRRRRIRSPEKQTVQDFGQALFQALLSGQVGDYYDEILHKAKQQNKGLRLKLHIQPPELAMLPWEFLYDPKRNAYLCLSTKTPLVRYVDLHEPGEQLPVTPPLRILGMVASPSDLPDLKVENEKRRVEEAIRDLEAKGRVELTWLEGQTSRDLLRAMRHGPWHVFHFIGHGDFDPDSKEGRIALADEAGNARFLRGENLAELLKDHWDLRLVLLNSCEGARGSEHDAFSSTAASLVRPGVPAVLANQYEISDDAAVEFSRAFYEAVADGLPLDAAVAAARTSLKIEMGDTLEWVTPVLYMRSPDGRIFDIQEETEEEKDLLRRYRECVESVWADGELNRREAEWLSDYANNQLGLSPSTAADIECEVMSDTREAVLERQAREEEERRNRLDELYAQARSSHQAQEWQAVITAFNQINALDPEYPDPEELLMSAQEALVALRVTRRAAAMYEQGLRNINAEEWSQALRCFEEVKRLEPGFRKVEDLLSRVRYELDSEVQAQVWSVSSSSTKPDFLPDEQNPKPNFLPGEQKSRPDRPQSLPD
jgi:CHAT domain-containing protein